MASARKLGAEHGVFKHKHNFCVTCVTADSHFKALLTLADSWLRAPASALQSFGTTLYVALFQAYSAYQRQVGRRYGNRVPLRRGALTRAAGPAFPSTL